MPTQVAAVAAVVVRRRRRPGGVALHVPLVLGRCVSFVTASTVDASGGPGSRLEHAERQAAVSDRTLTVGCSAARLLGW